MARATNVKLNSSRSESDREGFEVYVCSRPQFDFSLEDGPQTNVKLNSPLSESDRREFNLTFVLGHMRIYRTNQERRNRETKTEESPPLATGATRRWKEARKKREARKRVRSKRKIAKREKKRKPTYGLPAGRSGTGFFFCFQTSPHHQIKQVNSNNLPSHRAVYFFDLVVGGCFLPLLGISCRLLARRLFERTVTLTVHNGMKNTSTLKANELDKYILTSRASTSASTSVGVGCRCDLM